MHKESMGMGGRWGGGKVDNGELVFLIDESFFMK